MIYKLLTNLYDLQVLRILLRNLLLLHYFYYAIFIMSYFMLYNCYIIFHELHPVILFSLSLCVTFLHIFLTMIFLNTKLSWFIIRLLVFNPIMGVAIDARRNLLIITETILKL